MPVPGMPAASGVKAPAWGAPAAGPSAALPVLGILLEDLLLLLPTLLPPLLLPRVGLLGVLAALDACAPPGGCGAVVGEWLLGPAEIAEGGVALLPGRLLGGARCVGTCVEPCSRGEGSWVKLKDRRTPGGEGCCCCCGPSWCGS